MELFASPAVVITTLYPSATDLMLPHIRPLTQEAKFSPKLVETDLRFDISELLHVDTHSALLDISW